MNTNDAAYTTEIAKLHNEIAQLTQANAHLQRELDRCRARTVPAPREA
jgi:hypothetical protein